MKTTNYIKTKPYLMKVTRTDTNFDTGESESKEWLEHFNTMEEMEEANEMYSSQCDGETNFSMKYFRVGGEK